MTVFTRIFSIYSKISDTQFYKSSFLDEQFKVVLRDFSNIHVDSLKVDGIPTG